MKLYKKKNEREVKNNSAIYSRGKDRTPELSEKFISDLNFRISYLYSRFVEKSCCVKFVTGQPYNNLEEMSEDFFKNNVLKVSKDHDNSPIFNIGNSNLKNRALHDFLHCMISAPFTYEGEKKVYEKTIEMMPKKYHKIMYSEFVLQTAYTVNHGKFPVQKVVY